MAEHHEHEEVKGESLLEKISGKIHDHDSSSSSDSDNDKTSATDSFKSNVFRLFGREKPIHHVLGGGKRMRLPSFFLLSFFCIHNFYQLFCLCNLYAEFVRFFLYGYF